MKRDGRQRKEWILRRRKCAIGSGRRLPGWRGACGQDPGIRTRANRTVLMCDVAGGGVRRLIPDRFLDTGRGTDLGPKSAATGLSAEK